MWSVYRPLPLVLGALLSGCGPSPYDAFVECRTAIENAATLVESGDCFLQAEAEFLHTDEERAEYLADVRKPALDQLTLVRTDPLEPASGTEEPNGSEGGERVALRFDVEGEPGTDVVTGFSAIMRSVDGAWRYERPMTFFHGDYQNTSQENVSGEMDFTGALDREGDRIVGAVHTDGERRALALIDRFDGARVTFVSPGPFSAGRYIVGNEVEAEARLDPDRYFTQDVTGHLEILEAGPDGWSGTFTFSADSNHSGPLEVSGRFEGVREVGVP